MHRCYVEMVKQEVMHIPKYNDFAFLKLIFMSIFLSIIFFRCLYIVTLSYMQSFASQRHLTREEVSIHIRSYAYMVVAPQVAIKTFTNFQNSHSHMLSRYFSSIQTCVDFAQIDESFLYSIPKRVIFDANVSRELMKEYASPI